MMGINSKGLDTTFQRLYSDELPEFINSLKSIDNLPESLSETILTVEKNIEENKALIAPLLADAVAVGATTGVLGGIAGGIFGRLAKKEQMRKFSGKKLIAIADNATHFNETVERIKRLLGTEENTKPDYESLTPQERQKLLLLADEMKTLSEKLTEQLAA